jgi:hypothetical protein
LLGPNAGGLSASTIARLKEVLPSQTVRPCALWPAIHFEHGANRGGASPRNKRLCQAALSMPSGGKWPAQRCARGARSKVGNEGVITVEEAKSLETELEVVAPTIGRAFPSLTRQNDGIFNRKAAQKQL